MDELISRAYVLAEYDRQHQGPPGGARKIMEDAPAVDAVPVVFCKDCKYYNTSGCSAGYGWCEDSVINTGTCDDFYCARGERSESE